MSTSIFVTREIADDSSLYQKISALGCTITGQALIATETIERKETLPTSQWIFFSSKQAVHHFFAQYPSPKATQWAAIGEGTARELKKYGEVAFIGSAVETTQVAKEFARIVGKDKVLFPINDISVRTVQNELSESQVIDWVCYRTSQIPSEIGYHDIVVFSSPSNVDSFFKVNKWLSTQKAIAFGKSTGSRLVEMGVESPIISQGVSDQALLNAIKTAISS